MISPFQPGGELEHFLTFATSLAIGLLIGLERERSQAAKAGLRTFALVSMLGTLAALLSQKTNSPWLLLAGFLLVGTMTIIANLRNHEDPDPGTTTVTAILICYSLGVLVWYGDTTSLSCLRL